MNNDKQRQDPFAAALADFDPNQISSKRKIQERPDVGDVGALAEHMNFPSRQAPGNTHTEPVLIKRDRRRRTGRNIQIGMKARQETVNLLHNICDQLDLPYGEALHLGLVALAKEKKLEL